MLQIFTFTKKKNNFLIAKSINILLSREKKLVCVVCLFNIFLLKNICNNKVE